jgi:mannitol-1-phosphate 5-dehydrogenase
MKKESMPTLLQFGAGRIGRSFIAQLFSRSGYQVIFVDVDETIVSEMNRRGSYPVVIKSNEGDEILHIQNVKAILAREQKKIEEAMTEADIVSVSVGQHALPAVTKSIAKGLEVRYTRYPTKPLDIILAENLRDADQYFRRLLDKELPSSFPLDEFVGMIETSIGKMVPIMPVKDIQKDPLKVYAEPYNTLILDRQAFKNSIPDVEGLAPKNNMKAWVDRKLFIHNLGHAASAYIGNCFYPQKKYVWEVLEDPIVNKYTREAMVQAAQVLLHLYPEDFTWKDLEEHIDELLERFKNKALGDTVFRVGCDLGRKLGPDDRLAAPIRLAWEHKLPYEKILYAYLCAMEFKAKGEDNRMLDKDIRFRENHLKKGWDHVMKEISGFDPVKYKEILDLARSMKQDM